LPKEAGIRSTKIALLLKEVGPEDKAEDCAKHNSQDESSKQHCKMLFLHTISMSNVNLNGGGAVAAVAVDKHLLHRQKKDGARKQ
jgi:hypothetical protein